MRRIALATSQAYQSLTTDDQALLRPLTARGISGEPVIWSDKHFPWPSVGAVILRSCWDYHLRLPEFLVWLTYLEEQGVEYRQNVLVRAIHCDRGLVTSVTVETEGRSRPGRRQRTLRPNRQRHAIAGARDDG